MVIAQILTIPAAAIQAAAAIQTAAAAIPAAAAIQTAAAAIPAAAAAIPAEAAAALVTQAGHCCCKMAPTTCFDTRLP